MTLNNFIPTTVMMSHEPKVVVVCGAMCDVAFVIQKTRMLHTKDNPDITYKRPPGAADEQRLLTIIIS